MDTELCIKENSWIPQLAAKKLRSKNAAIVIRKTIYLYNVIIEDFLADTEWVKHEICHIRQFEEYGFFRFILMYLWESIKYGYYKNKFEIEARNAGTNKQLFYSTYKIHLTPE
jgi:hypothetical protein